MRKIATALFIALSAHVEASSVDVAGKFEQLKGTREMAYYMHATMQAFTIANMELEISRHPPIYCQPREFSAVDVIAMTSNQISIAKKVYGEKFDEMPIGIVLLDALKTSFPCR
ncbi:hypothetical protein ACQCLI_18795 [Pseudomonas nitroreducens]|uniref:hypothetical protein n=1 Tax=Pseudomonas TaxID=286 RepID=UPI00037170F0|nr:hypothetical protein [Pseudomonas nitroreducens]